ncbi:MAG: formylglycine-generating enzyme family protein [Alphaproteobacteria bacterium]|nr:formylglycine-generating enzyme family protein [Alphaproteobacteria bacterium]
MVASTRGVLERCSDLTLALMTTALRLGAAPDSEGSRAQRVDGLLAALTHGASAGDRRAEASMDTASWEVSARSVVGAFGPVSGSAAREAVEAFAALAEALAAKLPSREGRLLGVAAAALAAHRRNHFEGHPLLETLPRTLAARFAAGGAAWTWRDRILALDALGALGDPRLPDPRTSSVGWGEVPAGRHRLGGDRMSFRSFRARRVSLDRFLLRAWPVTVGEYAAFVAAEGYRDARWWDPAAVRPTGPALWPALVDHKTRPMRGVSWWEARAFCRWAQQSWVLPEGGALDLPTSEEWEAAARLGHDGPYPWGEEEPGRGDTARACYDWGDVPLTHPAPVGAFPGGNAGPWLDLAGNVWEWCASRYRRDHQQDSDLRIGDAERADDVAEPDRVIRGGAWNVHATYLRCAHRFRFPPDCQDEVAGLRLCVRFPKDAKPHA